MFLAKDKYHNFVVSTNTKLFVFSFCLVYCSCCLVEYNKDLHDLGTQFNYINNPFIYHCYSYHFLWFSPLTMEFYHHEIKVKKAFPRTIDPSSLRCISDWSLSLNNLFVTCFPFEHSRLYVFNNVNLSFLSVSSYRYFTSNHVPSHCKNSQVALCPCAAVLLLQPPPPSGKRSPPSQWLRPSLA